GLKLSIRPTLVGNWIAVIGNIPACVQGVHGGRKNRLPTKAAVLLSRLGLFRARRIARKAIMCQLPRRRLAVGRQFTLVLVDVGTWIRLCSRRWLSNIASQEQRIV